jgi:hypothetical protein
MFGGLINSTSPPFFACCDIGRARVTDVHYSARMSERAPSPAVQRSRLFVHFFRVTRSGDEHRLDPMGWRNSADFAPRERMTLWLVMRESAG